MVYDPTDERYRKPRRLGNTRLHKYLHLVSFSVVCVFAIGTYLTFKRHVFPLVKDEEYKIYGSDSELLRDHMPSSQFLTNFIEKRKEKQKSETKAETESKDT